MNVRDAIIERLQRLLGPSWELVPRAGGVDLVRPGGRVAAAWSTERRRLVQLVAEANEPLRAYAGSALLSLLATDPAGETARAALAALRAALGLVDVPVSEQEQLLREAESLRAERAALHERQEATRRERQAEAARQREAADALARELGTAWGVEASKYGTQLTRAGEAGAWLVLSHDPATPEGLAAVRAVLQSSAAPFRLLGRGASRCVVTWVDVEAPSSRELAARLALVRPTAELEAQLDARDPLR